MLAKAVNFVIILLFIGTGTVLGDWEDLSSFTGTTEDLHGVSFVNENLGWAVGDQGTIITTTDGGYNWTDQSMDEMSDKITEVDFINSTDGWFCTSEGEIYKTDDGGENWNLEFSDDTYYFTDISIHSAIDGWVVGGAPGYHGIMIRLTQSRPAWRVNCGTGTPLHDIYTYGGNWNVFITYDAYTGGHYYIKRRQPNHLPPYYTWEAVLDLYQADIHDLTFSENNPNFGWAATEIGSYYTVDGGNNWSIIADSPGDQILVSCYEYNNFMVAWSLQNYDTIYFTKGTGIEIEPWEDWVVDDDDIPGSTLYRSMDCGGTNGTVSAYIVGSQGTVLKTAIGTDTLGETLSTFGHLISDLQVTGVTSSSLSIRLNSASAVDAGALIYDMTGRLMSSVNLGFIPAGSSTYNLEINSGSGRTLPVGVYYLAIDVGNDRVSCPFVVIN